jgi:G protein-coupled receptor 157
VHGLGGDTMLFSLLGLAVRHSIVARDANTLTGETRQTVASSPNESINTNCINGTPNGVLPSVRVVVGITCALSMIGAVLIILSYILIKETRTKPREILLNLSLMDFIVAAANLIGILINFDDFLRSDSPYQYPALNHVCKVQASFAMYATISSILWTNCIAVYIFFHILYERQLKTFWTMLSFYVLSYGLPLILILWFLFTDKLGYSPYGSSGWCSVIVYNYTTGERYPLTLVFANDIWFYLTITLVPLIFISLKFHLKYQV